MNIYKRVCTKIQKGFAERLISMKYVDIDRKINYENIKKKTSIVI